ncbi:MAG TPA: von Willebrand factor type A domain-containing protein, partial [Dongiaceae bacterium]
MTAAEFSFDAWHRSAESPANLSMSHSRGDRLMFRKWLMATAAVLLIGGGIAAATHGYWHASVHRYFAAESPVEITFDQRHGQAGGATATPAKAPVAQPSAPEAVAAPEVAASAKRAALDSEPSSWEIFSSLSSSAVDERSRASNAGGLAINVYGRYVSDQAGQWQPPSVAGENYQDFKTNPVKLVAEEPVSTFSIDVDTASYANVRRFLTQGVLPPVDAVRTEELINYFDYTYPLPESKDEPFRADVALFDSPWDGGSRILRLGIQGYDIPAATRPPANLVFLVDTSGSMNHPDKLPLVKQSLRMLVDQMGPEDSIGIVAYAGSAGVVLEPTKGSDQRKIEAAIDSFIAGGSTAGGEGIRQAYALAESAFEKDAINRVILATDGD